MLKRMALLTLFLAAAWVTLWLRPLPTVRQAQPMADRIHYRQTSRSYRWLPLREWGFGTGGYVACGNRVWYQESKRVGFFEVADLTETWSESLQGQPTH